MGSCGLGWCRGHGKQVCLVVALRWWIGLLGVWSSNLPSLLLFSWCAWWASLSPVVFLPCSSWVFLGLVLSAWLGPSSCLFGRFLLAWFACPVGMFWFLSCSSVSLHFRVPLFPGLDASPLALRFSLGLTSWWIPWQCLVASLSSVVFLVLLGCCFGLSSFWSWTVGLSLSSDFDRFAWLSVLPLGALPFPGRCLVVPWCWTSWCRWMVRKVFLAVPTELVGWCLVSIGSEAGLFWKEAWNGELVSCLLVLSCLVVLFLTVGGLDWMAKGSWMGGYGRDWSWIGMGSWGLGWCRGKGKQVCLVVDWVLVRLVRNAVSEAKGVGGLVGVSLLFSRKGLLGLIGCSLGLWIPCSVDSSLFVSLAVGIGLLGVWSSNLPLLLLFAWCAWWNRFRLRSSSLVLLGCCLGLSSFWSFAFLGFRSLHLAFRPSAWCASFLVGASRVLLVVGSWCASLSFSSWRFLSWSVLGGALVLVMVGVRWKARMEWYWCPLASME